MRKSTIQTQSDSAGTYDIEVFDCPEPKRVVVCVHGKGVRRWDGEKFLYNFADHYPGDVFLLVDQNQFTDDACQLNPLPIAASRVQNLIKLAQQKYPNVPIIVVGHSMGCGVITQLDLQAVEKVIFVAPTAGDETKKLISSYGADIVEGKLTISSDGIAKYMSKEFVQSMQGIVWEEEYRKLLERYKPVYVFESGEEEIVGEDRLAHRDMPFASYTIIPGAKHNLSGATLEQFFTDLTPLL